MKISKQQILREFDLAYSFHPGEAFPIASNDTKYNVLFDLEDGYTAIAGNKIHLYSKNEKWVVVVEVTGLNVSNHNYVLELFYYGNAFRLRASDYNSKRSLSNVHCIELRSRQTVSAFTPYLDDILCNASAKFYKGQSREL